MASKTYSGDPSSSDGDFVRFVLGDTESSTMQLTDEEIEAALRLYPNTDLAAAFLAENLAGRFARKVDKSVGDLSISYGNIAKNYIDMALRLRRSASVDGAPPYAGGISVSDKQSTESNTDRVAPIFTKGMHDNSGTSTDQTGEN